MASKPRKRTLPTGVYAVGDRYRVSYHPVRGTQMFTRAVFTTPEQAEAWRRFAHECRDAGAQLPPEPGLSPQPGQIEGLPRVKHRTVAQHGEVFLARHLQRVVGQRNATVRGWLRNYVNVPFAVDGVDWPSVGSRILGTVSRDHLDAWMNWVVTVEKDPAVYIAGRRTRGIRSRGTARQMLWLVRSIHEDARDLDPDVRPLPGGVFIPPELPQARRRLPDEAVGLTTVKRIAAALAPADRLTPWLLVLGSLRISEAHGIRLDDFDPVKGELRISRQGGAHRASERGSTRAVELVDRTKSRSGRRVLPLPRQFVELLLAYVEEFHGLTAEDFTPGLAGGSWGPAGGARLVRGVQGGNPDNARWRDHFVAALEAVGPHDETLQRFEALGSEFRPHHLRKSLPSFFATNPAVPGAALSAYLGHRVRGGEEDAAQVTSLHYTVRLRSALEKLRAEIEHWIDAEVGTLSVADADRESLGLPREGDLLSSAQVAELLGVSVRKVGALRRDGLLVPTRHPQADQDRSCRGYFFRREDVDGYRQALEPEGSRAHWLEAAAAADKLGVGRRQVAHLCRQGILEAEKQQRVSTNRVLRQVWVVNPDSIQRYLAHGKGQAA